MFFTYTRKPHYYETDQMAVIHHSNYIRWYEESRVDFLEKAGFPIEKIEEDGIQIPVIEVQSRYHKMVRLTDIIEVRIKIDLYTGTRMNISYELFNQRGELCNSGATRHCFITNQGRATSLKRHLPKLHEELIKWSGDETLINHKV